MLNKKQETITKELKIEGMHCVSCERTIATALKKEPGVLDASVNFVSSEALIQFNKDQTSTERLVEVVQSTGYNAYPIDGKSTHEIESGEEKNFHIQLWTVVLSALLTLPLLLQMFFEFMGMGIVIPLWLQFTLATLVQFVFGWRFYVGSFYALKTFTGNMDLLIGLGTSAAYLYSAFVFFLNLSQHVYFESSAAIITLILLGRLLELRTKRKASGAIKALFKLQPKLAHIKKGDAWEEIPIEEIQIGDLFQVKPGEKIPVDGLVIDGDSYVDESMLTGESNPVHKLEKTKIYGGTQNQQGFLIGQAKAVGSETALANIIRLVQEAQGSKAPVQKLADQISAIFVPIVVFISLLTFFLWWGITGQFNEALINSVAVLVIACPCALGMATPTVIMVGSGRGARSGILIKNADAIQHAQKLRVLAIDKTGTLTEGRPTLREVVTTENIPQEKLLQLAASLEDLSEHPIAKAIASSFSSQKLKVNEFQSFSGRGVEGKIEGKHYFIGSLRWIRELGLQIADEKTNSLEQLGRTVVCLADENQVYGYLAVSDTLREHSKEGIDRIKKEGIKVVMLTGDHPKTAKAIADEAGISSYIAEVLPEDKAKKVESLKQTGQLVGMVGDGVNDAPALAAADVGFSMSTGTDVAIEASDITLMRNDLRHVADAIDLSKKTFLKIKQNLFFAFIYNALGIPLAAFGLLNPIIAAAAMALSSLCVIGNSLLLNRWKAQAK